MYAWCLKNGRGSVCLKLAQKLMRCYTGTKNFWQTACIYGKCKTNFNYFRTMIRYFFKLAFRNIKKYKLNTLISLLGLTVGLTSFIIKLKVKTLQFHCSYFSFYKCFKFVVWILIAEVLIQ